jgi:membrane fusion protein, heavy metal efflux system
MTQQNHTETVGRGPRRRVLNRAAMAVGLLALGAASVAGVYRFAASATESRAQQPAPRSESTTMIRDGDRVTVPEGSPLRGKLVIAATAEKEIQRRLVLPAMVEADPALTVKVLPALAGRVTELKVQLGSRVTAGQILATIDSGDLAQAYSDEAKARSMLKLTTQALDRLMVLEKSSAIAVKDREQAQSDNAQAKAELERASLRLRAIGVSAEKAGDKERSGLLFLRAPVSGSVIDLQVAAGAYLNDPTAAIMTIADLSTVWVTGNVPEKDTALVTQGQSAEVVFPAYPTELFKGQVLFVSDVLDPDTRRTKVRIAFTNPELRLKPNMFASATFLAPPRSMPIVPTNALVLRNETDEVFVETAPWQFEARHVDIAFQDGDQAVVTSGLQPGQRVVIKGGVLLND